MIKIPESAYDVKQLFREANRDHYSLDACEYLYEEYEEIRTCYMQQGEMFEFDVIAWCCDWNEMSAEEYISSYGIDMPDDWLDMSKEEIVEYVLAELNEHTYAIETSDGILCRVY